jgi:CMP-2-keto-3-deoxyoctulosonic acid synthetase
MKKYLDYISFKRDALLNFVKLKQSVLELLRATKNNFKVDTFKNKNDLFSFNTKKELNKVIQIIEFSR